MKVKAISLWQPWASLIWTGAKTYETRSWPTSYRGPLLICAAKKVVPDTAQLWVKFRKGLATGFEWEIPYGKAICIVDLTDCIHTAMLNKEQIGNDLPYGDFNPGRFAWKLANLRRLDRYYPVKGHQGLWDQEIPFDLNGKYLEAV